MVRQSVIRITDRKCRCAIFAVSEPKASPDLRPKTTEPIEKTNLFVKPSAIEFTRIAEAGKRKTKFNDTMKRIWMTTFLSLTLCAGPCGGRARANDNPPQEKTANPKVYLTRTITPEALVRIYEALGREATGRVAVKLSTGEPGGHHFLQPALVAPLVRKVGGTIVECNTAYGGGRARTADHLKAAADHGFTAIAAVDIMDAEGETALPVEGGRHLAEDYVGKNFLNYDFTVVLSHFKGHAMGGFGGAIKNLAMGCAPQAGKIDQHGRNVVIYPKCIGCGQCVPLCPRNALSLEKAEKGRHAVIDKERCIGCYECVTACKQGAIGVDTPNEYSDFAERMAEYAYGAVKGKEGRICYLNFLLNVTPQCDCAGWSEPAIVPDLGILASEDPVALDTACFDLVKEAYSLIPLGEHGAHSCGYDKFSALHPNTRGWHQVEYAESIGMGLRDYELITV